MELIQPRLSRPYHVSFQLARTFIDITLILYFEIAGKTDVFFGEMLWVLRVKEQFGIPVASFGLQYICCHALIIVLDYHLV